MKRGKNLKSFPAQVSDLTVYPDSRYPSPGWFYLAHRNRKKYDFDGKPNQSFSAVSAARRILRRLSTKSKRHRGLKYRHRRLF